MKTKTLQRIACLLAAAVALSGCGKSDPVSQSPAKSSGLDAQNASKSAERTTAKPAAKPSAEIMEKARLKLAQLGKDYSAKDFVASCAKGDITVVRLFLDAGMNPITKFREDAPSSLALAAHDGHVAVVRLLIEQADTEDDYALVLAAAGNSLDCVQAIAEKMPGTVRRSGAMALCVAAGNDRHQNVEYLVEKKGVSVDSKNDEGSTPLLVAVSRGSAVTVGVLVALGADVNVRYEVYYNLLDLAVRQMSVAYLAQKTDEAIAHTVNAQFLRKRGLKLSDRFKEFYMAEVLRPVFKVFVFSDIQPGIKAGADDLRLGLSGAMSGFLGGPECKNGLLSKSEIVEIHLSTLGTLIARSWGQSNGEQCKAIQAACADSLNAHERLWLEATDEKDFNPNMTNKHCCVLACAAFGGNAPIVKKLLEKGADVNLKNSEGKTPLDMAKKANGTEMVVLLEKAGGKVGAIDPATGNTPAILAPQKNAQPGKEHGPDALPRER